MSPIVTILQLLFCIYKCICMKFPAAYVPSDIYLLLFIITFISLRWKIQHLYVSVIFLKRRAQRWYVDGGLKKVSMLITEIS